MEHGEAGGGWVRGLTSLILVAVSFSLASRFEGASVGVGGGGRPVLLFLSLWP